MCDCTFGSVCSHRVVQLQDLWCGWSENSLWPLLFPIATIKYDATMHMTLFTRSPVVRLSCILCWSLEVPEQALDGIPLGLGLVAKINLLNFHETRNLTPMTLCIVWGPLWAILSTCIKTRYQLCRQYSLPPVVMATDKYALVAQYYLPPSIV